MHNRTSRRLLLLTLCLLPSAAGAQLVTGIGRAGLTINASLAVPVQMKVRPLGEARPVRQEAAFTEYAIDLSASANVDWVLAVALAQPSPLGTTVQLLAEDGTWTELSADDLTGEVVVRGGPSNAHRFVVSFRLMRSTGKGTAGREGEIPRLRMIMAASDVAR